MKRTLFAALVVFSGLVIPISTSAALSTAVPAPATDPFYRVPSGIAGLANGTILGSRPITAYADGIPVAAHAWQIRYKTLGAHGAPTAAIATVLVPNTPWIGRGRRPLVSYDLAEDGVGLRCTPSYALRAGLAAGDTIAAIEVDYGVPQLLARNWAVVLPDWEGPHSAFASAPTAAHAVLDGIRAARRFRPAGVAQSPVAMWGYSGGSFATTVAAMAQPSYAPRIPLRAVAIGGVPGDLRAVFNAAAGGAAGGATLLLLTGLSRANPGAHLSRYLDSTARRAVAAGSQDCLVDAILRYPLFNLGQHMAAKGLQVFQTLMRANSPLYLAGRPKVPVFQYQALTDELVPYAAAAALAQHFCHEGVRLDFSVSPVGEHAVEEVVGGLQAVSYLADRFAGKPAPTTCS